MSDEKHTPGPWFSEGFAIKNDVYSELGLAYGYDKNAESNARLMAAAPELLDALECVLAVDLVPMLPAEYVARVRAAIAKARGES